MNTMQRTVGGAAACLLLAGVAIAPAVNLYWDADGAGSAATGGTGTWDTTTALWHNGSTTGTLQLWTNNSGSPDVACFPTAVGTVTLAPATTFYANGLNFAVNGYTIQGAAGSTIQFVGTNPLITGGGSCSATVNAALGTGTGLTVGMGGATLTLNNSAGNQLTGSGRVTIAQVGSAWGSTLAINYSQAAFAGGFNVVNWSHRAAALAGNAADTLGTGTAVATGGSRIDYTWGAQTAGGAADGGPAGVTANVAAGIHLAGTYAASKDRFILAQGGALRGNSARLAAVNRVADFTPYAGATGPEALFARGSVITNTDGTAATGTVQNLGTAGDLLIGLATNFNNAAWSQTIGAGTPWLGFGKDSNGFGDSQSFRLQKGTVTINDGGGTFGEMVFRSAGVDYSNNPLILYLGSGADSPLFQPAAGGGKVLARVLTSGGQGEVRIDTTNPQFSSAISAFAVGSADWDSGNLVIARSIGLGTDLAIEDRGVTTVANSTVDVGAITYAGSAHLRVDQAGSNATLTGTSLTRSGKGLLALTAVDGTASLGDATAPNELVKVTGFSTGRAPHSLFAVDASLFYPEFVEYDATNGFKVVTYDETASINNGGNGKLGRFTAAQTLTSSQSYRGLAVQQSVSGAYTLSLGKNSDGSQAADAGLYLLYPNSAGTQTIAAAVDFGASEGILVAPHTGYYSRWQLTGALQGSGGLTVWTAETSSSYGLQLRGNNTLTGPITIHRGLVRTTAGTGFDATSALYLGKAATYEVGIASETLAGLTGYGTVTLPAAGNALTIGNAADCTFDGVISGLGSLAKSGAGVFTLTGANTYAGATTVTGGTLRVTGSLASPVTVSAGRLDGTGVINGSVGLSGGTVAPGLSPGVLEITGDLTLGPSVTTEIELGGTLPGDGASFYDQLLVGGSAVLDGTLGVSLIGGFVPTGADVFYFLARDSGSGIFAGLPEGASLTLGLYAAQITYLADWTGTQAGSALTGGNDVALYNFVVPEPGAALLLVGLAAAAAGRRRRAGR